MPRAPAWHHTRSSQHGRLCRTSYPRACSAAVTLSFSAPSPVPPGARSLSSKCTAVGDKTTSKAASVHYVQDSPGSHAGFRPFSFSGGFGVAEAEQRVCRALRSALRPSHIRRHQPIAQVSQPGLRRGERIAQAPWDAGTGARPRGCCCGGPSPLRPSA